VGIRTGERDYMSACSECGCKASEGWALYCVKCSESQTEKNDFNPDWDQMAVLVEENQRLAKREWVGLTNDEITEIDQGLDARSYSLFAYTRAIEAKLSEKNHVS